MARGLAIGNCAEPLALPENEPVPLPEEDPDAEPVSAWAIPAHSAPIAIIKAVVEPKILSLPSMLRAMCAPLHRRYRGNCCIKRSFASQ
ncbi:hypothetical protein GCM10010198_48890 [Nocardia seriolae]|nr:hypothetical protein NSERKGN1266_29600 [Nocardia seriolae]BEK97214.1 hypothetical protein NSER024013_51200 [Nocardia seriolae]GEM22666.1 hypothetical protein NS2_09050 [Nocardia seriolae NBRC 15557]